LLDRRRARPSDADAVAASSRVPSAPQVATATVSARPSGSRRLALSLAFVSGLTSLGYQVVWNRLIGAGTGSSTYVFTIILALFLVGIAVGAVLLGFLRPRVRPTTLLIATAQVLTAVFVLVGASVLASPQA